MTRELREKAFRRYLAELVRYLALSPRDQQETRGLAYKRLSRYGSGAGDPNAYLFRIGRAIAYEGRHRRIVKGKTR